MFIEEFFRFVDLGGQVGATTTIGVVEQHELAVVLADLLLGESSLTERKLSVLVDSVMGCRGHIRKLQDQGGFATGHALIESSVYR